MLHVETSLPVLRGYSSLTHILQKIGCWHGGQPQHTDCHNLSPTKKVLGRAAGASSCQQQGTAASLEMVHSPAVMLESWTHIPSCSGGWSPQVSRNLCSWAGGVLLLLLASKWGFWEMLTTGLSFWQRCFLDGLSTADNSNILTLRNTSPSIINPMLLSKVERWREMKLGHCCCRFVSGVGGTFSWNLVSCEGPNNPQLWCASQTHHGIDELFSGALRCVNLWQQKAERKQQISVFSAGSTEEGLLLQLPWWMNREHWVWCKPLCEEDPGNGSAHPKEVVSAKAGSSTGGRGRNRKAGEEIPTLPPAPQSHRGNNAVKCNLVMYTFTKLGTSQGFRVILLWRHNGFD